MTQRLADKHSFGRKLLLAAIGVAVVAGPVVFGLVNAPQVRAQSPPTTDAPLPSFEIASIKPNHAEDPHGFIRSPGPGRFTVANVATETHNRICVQH